MSNSIVRDNYVIGVGPTAGGIWARRIVTISNSTISGNKGSGTQVTAGGVLLSGTITVAYARE